MADDQTATRLRDATEQIYRAFATERPASIDGCPCCIAERGVDVLLTTPLRQIPGEALWPYVSGAFLTIGSVEDFRYLLPRILEVSAFEPENANNPEIVLGKLSLAGWQSWPAGETRAIRTFIDAWFDHALGDDLLEAEQGWVGWDAEAVLCGASRAGLPLASWLARLCEPDAAPVLADMRQRLPDDPFGFWETVPEGYRELQTILTKGRA